MSVPWAHPAVQSDCPRCRGRSVLVVREGEFCKASLCGCVGVCPHCRDTGYLAVGEERNAPRAQCSCREIHRRMRLFDGVRIPARHRDSSVANFEVRGPLHGVLLQTVQNWLDQYQPGEDNRGLVLFGAVGRGKTHLMVAVLRELVFRYGVSARFVEFSHLLADLKSSFDRGSGASSLLDPLVRVEVLAIDELGKGRNTQFEGTVVDELVSRRYNAASTILGTTNYSPAPPTGLSRGNASDPNQQDLSLADRVSERVYSRLQQMSQFIEVVGEDFRISSRDSGQARASAEDVNRKLRATAAAIARKLSLASAVELPEGEGLSTRERVALRAPFLTLRTRATEAHALLERMREVPEHWTPTQLNAQRQKWLVDAERALQGLTRALAHPGLRA